MIEIAVCDDDTLFMTSRLNSLITSAFQETDLKYNISFFNDGNILLNRFKKHKYYHMVFLDVEMPEINGKELAQKLRDIDSLFYLVFVTSHNDEIHNTVRLHMNAFISKAKSDRQIIGDLIWISNDYMKFNPQYEMFHTKEDGEKFYIKIAKKDIYYFSYIGGDNRLYTVDEEHILVEKDFRDIKEKYIKEGFFETCQGYLVNVNKCKDIGSYDALLDNGVKVPISRRKHRELVAAFTKVIEQEVIR